jgi:integrase
MARRTLTDRGVDALKTRASRYHFPDPELKGHYIRVLPTGVKTYAVVTRDPQGKQTWATIGSTTHLGIEAARAKARTLLAAIKTGEDRAGPEHFKAISDQWFKRHVEAKGLRTTPAIRRYLDLHINPVFGSRTFTSVKRGDVARLLDSIEDNAGPVAASKALAYLSGIFNWYAKRHDDYASPLVKGMGRSTPTERARDRILSDDEIRAVWSAATGTFGDLVKLLLLTGQRRDKVASMKWEDISIDGVWKVPEGPRDKGTGGDLVLPEMVLEIIRARPHFADNPYVLAGRGGSYINGFSKSKRALDAKLSDLQTPWQLHDLRRTARSLMSRAGIRSEHAERVLGHVISGVEGIYDRHAYREEKAHALRALASLIDAILQPPAKKVVRLARSTVA